VTDEPLTRAGLSPGLADTDGAACDLELDLGRRMQAEPAPDRQGNRHLTLRGNPHGTSSRSLTNYTLTLETDAVVKALDGRSINGKSWVFYGSLTNVEFTLTVTDTLTGAVRTYFNPQGQLASVADTSAF
jgi:hypothetical protein